MQSRHLEPLQQPLGSPESAAGPTYPLLCGVPSQLFKVSLACPAPPPPTDDILLPVPVLRSLWASDPPALPGQDVAHPCGVLAPLQISRACRAPCSCLYCVSWMPAEVAPKEGGWGACVWGCPVPFSLSCSPQSDVALHRGWSWCVGFSRPHPPGWRPILWHLPWMRYVQRSWNFPFQAFRGRGRGELKRVSLWN